MTTSEMIKFYNEYKADQLDGFVSNIKSYVESKLKGLTKEEIKDIIEDLEILIQDDNTN